MSLEPSWSLTCRPCTFLASPRGTDDFYEMNSGRGPSAAAATTISPVLLVKLQKHVTRSLQNLAQLPAVVLLQVLLQWRRPWSSWTRMFGISLGLGMQRSWAETQYQRINLSSRSRGPGCWTSLDSRASRTLAVLRGVWGVWASSRKFEVSGVHPQRSDSGCIRQSQRLRT